MCGLRLTELLIFLPLIAFRILSLHQISDIVNGRREKFCFVIGLRVSRSQHFSQTVSYYLWQRTNILIEPLSALSQSCLTILFVVTTTKHLPNNQISHANKPHCDPWLRWCNSFPNLSQITGRYGLNSIRILINVWWLISGETSCLDQGASVLEGLVNRRSAPWIIATAAWITSQVMSSRMNAHWKSFWWIAIRSKTYQGSVLLLIVTKTNDLVFNDLESTFISRNCSFVMVFANSASRIMKSHCCLLLWVLWPI